MRKILEKWGWKYDITMTKGNAFRDIFYSALPFVAIFLIFPDLPIGDKFLLSYFIGSVIAGIFFVIRLDVLYQQGCLLLLIWLAISPVIGIIYLPVMFVKAAKKMFS